MAWEKLAWHGFQRIPIYNANTIDEIGLETGSAIIKKQHGCDWAKFVDWMVPLNMEATSGSGKTLDWVLEYLSLW